MSKFWDEKEYSDMDKGLERTYGRGAGERQYRRIPLTKNKRRVASRLYDSAHAKYPQTGAYKTEEPENSPAQ